MKFKNVKIVLTVLLMVILLTVSFMAEDVMRSKLLASSAIILWAVVANFQKKEHINEN